MKAMHELAKVRHLHLHESVVPRARPGLSNKREFRSLMARGVLLA